MKCFSHIITTCTVTALTVTAFVFSAQAQTPAEIRSWIPPIEGWTISENVEVFTPENLFDRINGAAPLFIENNFREMTSVEYIKGDDRITIQAYRHATPEDTFGMYSSERSTGMEFFPFGAEAQGDDQSMYFFAGNIYVKMWSNASENVAQMLQTIASTLANKIAPDAAYPTVVKAFPENGKVPHTETYITSNYIGHEFLKGVYTSMYEMDGQTFQAFVIDAKTKEGAREILNKYFAFTKQPLDFDEGSLTIKDRFNGDIEVVWHGRYIAGIFSENGDTITNAGQLLDLITTNLASF